MVTDVREWQRGASLTSPVRIHPAEIRRDTDSIQAPAIRPIHCALCAREAGFATVYRGGRAFCSIECAEAEPGRYLG